MNRKMLIWGGGGTVLLTALAAGGIWSYQNEAANPPRAAAPPASADTHKYISVDRIVVMLRMPSDAGFVPPYVEETHYAVLDLVLKTTPAQEAMARAHIPLLRSIAVRVAARYTLEDVRRKNLSEISASLNRAFISSYKGRHVEMPFEKAMISRLLVE